MNRYAIRKLNSSIHTVRDAEAVIFVEGVNVLRVSHDRQNNVTYIVVEHDFDVNKNGNELEVF